MGSGFLLVEAEVPHRQTETLGERLQARILGGGAQLLKLRVMRCLSPIIQTHLEGAPSEAPPT